MKKQKIISLGMLVFLTMIIFIGIASATLYDELKELEGKHCNLVEKNSLSVSAKAALINKFSLTGGGNCEFVVDSLPLDSNTKNILGFGDVWYERDWYAEIIHKFYENKEYIFISAKDDSTLNVIGEFTADYEKYKYYLTSDRGFVLPEKFLAEYYDPEYFGPPDNDCVDSNGNIYTGNSGSYKELINGATINFNTACESSNVLSFPFCMRETFINSGYSCNCVANKCVASFSEVFNWFGSYGLGAEPRYRIVGDEFISSALKSWMDS